MAINQKKNREIIVQILYSFEMNAKEEEIIPALMHELKMSKKAVTDGYKTAIEIWEGRERWDELIAKRSDSYDFKRIGSVEKSILRMGLFELFAENKPNTKEMISELLRVAKKFCGDSAASFIHALIDSYVEDKRVFTNSRSVDF